MSQKILNSQSNARAGADTGPNAVCGSPCSTSARVQSVVSALSVPCSLGVSALKPSPCLNKISVNNATREGDRRMRNTGSNFQRRLALTAPPFKGSCCQSHLHGEHRKEKYGLRLRTSNLVLKNSLRLPQVHRDSCPRMLIIVELHTRLRHPAVTSASKSRSARD